MSASCEPAFDEFLDEQLEELKRVIHARHDNDVRRARTMAAGLAKGKSSGISFSEDLLDDDDIEVVAETALAKRKGKSDAHTDSHLLDVVRHEIQSEVSKLYEAVASFQTRTAAAAQAEINLLRMELADHREAQCGDNFLCSISGAAAKNYLTPSRSQSRRQSEVNRVSPLVDMSSRSASRRQSEVSRFAMVVSPLVTAESASIAPSTFTSRRPSQDTMSTIPSRLASFKPSSKQPRNRGKVHCGGNEEISFATLQKRLSCLEEKDGGIKSSETCGFSSQGSALVSNINVPDLPTHAVVGQSRKSILADLPSAIEDDCAVFSDTNSVVFHENVAASFKGIPAARSVRMNSNDTSFELLDGWEDSDDEDDKRKASVEYGKEFTISQSFYDCHDSELPPWTSTFTQERARWGWCSVRSIQPKGLFKVVWDLLSVLFVGFDAFVLPLYFVDIEETTFIVVMSWLTRIFWTIDISISCLTGYTRADGNLEMRPRHISRRYVRTWFPFDVTLVTLDWLQQLLSELLSTAGRLSRAGRIARLARLVRLIRIVRIVRLLGVIFENLDLSEKLSILANITLSLIAIICLMHFIGCIWYGLGHSSNNGWVISQSVQDEPFWTRYGFTLFWAAGLFTGNLDPVAYTGEERTFITIIMFFFFVVATSFISTFTSSITQFMVLTNSRNAQFTILRRYMKQHSISPRLCLRVTRNAKHVLDAKQKQTPEDEVQLLNVISEPLRRDLHHEIYSRVLVSHPLFYYFSKTNVPVTKKICHSALRFYNFSQGDVLFSPGEIPPCQVIFLRAGECQYTFGDLCAKPSSGEDHGLPVHPGQWICEPALWTSWTYRGLLRATVDCQVMVVSGDVLMEVNASSQFFDLSGYGGLYVEQLNKTGSACTDLAYEIEVDNIVEKAFEQTIPPKPEPSGQRGSLLSMSALFPAGR